MTDEYKIKWIERLFPIFGINDPANAIVRMMGYAFGRDVVARLGRLSHSDFIDGQRLLLFAVRNRAIAKTNMLRCADNFLFCLLSSFGAVKSRLELGPKQVEQLCLQYAFVLEHYGFPLLEVLTENKDKFVLILGLSAYKVAQIIDESGCRCGCSLTEMVDDSAWVGNLSTYMNRWASKTEHVLESLIEKLRSLGPLDRLFAMGSMILSPEVETDDEFTKGADELVMKYDAPMMKLFEILQECKRTLSESTLLEGGYMYYDHVLVDLFVSDNRFFRIHADEFKQVIYYIQNELPKHGDPKFHAHALNVLRKTMKRCGA